MASKLFQSATPAGEPCLTDVTVKHSRLSRGREHRERAMKVRLKVSTGFPRARGNAGSQFASKRSRVQASLGSLDKVVPRVYGLLDLFGAVEVGGRLQFGVRCLGVHTGNVTQRD